jgi:hypothetical protein
VDTSIFVFGAREAVKEGPGKPSSGPVAVVQLTEFNFCTQQIRELFGIAQDASVQVSEAGSGQRAGDHPRLRLVNGQEVAAVVDLTWSGAGDLVTQSNRFRLKTPGVMISEWFKGTFRPALVSRTVMLGDRNVATDPADASIFRARFGTFDVVRTQ